MNGEQIIPPITDPLGKSWKQPHRRFIELDDTHALMSEQTFKGLSEYSMSNPSGVYEGDIVTWVCSDGETRKDVVRWINGGLCLCNSQYAVGSYYGLEVVGNIHDNLELIN